MITRNAIIFLVLIVWCSCSDEPEVKQPSLKEIQEALLEANIKATGIEAQQIDAYIKQKELDVTSTGTGLRYLIYHKGEQSIKGALGKKAVINYQVTLLNGDTFIQRKENQRNYSLEKIMLNQDCMKQFN